LTTAIVKEDLVVVAEVANMVENLMAVLEVVAVKEAPVAEEAQKNLGALKANLLAITEVEAQEAEIEVVALSQKKNVSLNAEEIKHFLKIITVKKSQKFLLRFFFAF
jgi:D-ribose pyranose/furanose isomerase RbsD